VDRYQRMIEHVMKQREWKSKINLQKCSSQYDLLHMLLRILQHQVEPEDQSVSVVGDDFLIER
jgi:hypothetical protein